MLTSVLEKGRAALAITQEMRKLWRLPCKRKTRLAYSKGTPGGHATVRGKASSQA